MLIANTLNLKTLEEIVAERLGQKENQETQL